MSKEDRKPPAPSHPWKRPAVPQKRPQLDKLASVMPKELLKRFNMGSSGE
jgi:hypothetical protein